MDPRVAIVIVNWNRKKYVLDLLKSLRKIHYDNYQIVVVDNASTDGSADIIRSQFPDVDLIVNTKNLGGSGGFNTGIRYVLKKGSYKYVWLLDNDAEVEDGSLISNIQVLDANEKIGMVGSLILNKDYRDTIVECGAFIDWKRGTFLPNYRNIKLSRIKQDLVSVDYVPICSAVVRVKVLHEVGLMDERYFIIWDDMDLGIKILQAGYRVYANPMSRIYHPSFTEKENLISEYYYLIRNSLLFFSKYSRCPSITFYSILRRILIQYYFFKLARRSLCANLLRSALKDFLDNKWHQQVYNESNLYDYAEHFNEEDLQKVKKILVLPSGSIYSIDKVIKILSQYKKEKIMILTNEDRQDLMVNLNAPLLLIKNTGKPIKDFFSGLYKIIVERFDLGVDPNPYKTTSYAFVCKQTVFFHNGKFFKSNIRITKTWKILISYLLGELRAVLLLHIVLKKVLSYKGRSS